MDTMVVEMCNGITIVGQREVVCCLVVGVCI